LQFQKLKGKYYERSGYLKWGESSSRKIHGALKSTEAYDLAAVVMSVAIEKIGLRPDDIN